MNKSKIGISNFKKKFKYLYSTIAVSASLALTNSNYAYAADNKYAKNASNWVMDGIRSIAVAGAIFFIVKAATQRKFVQLIGTVVIAALMLAFVYNPNILRDIGETIVNIVNG